MRIIGIDPGLKGGISGLDTEDGTLWAIPTPIQTDRKTGKFEYNIPAIAKIISEIKPDKICIERVHSMPGDGKASSFKFGMGFGILLGITGTLGIPVTLVTPRVWKSKYSITADKETSRLKATEIFPDCAKFWKLKKHDGLAEAALLAYYMVDGTIDVIIPRDISTLYLTEVPNICTKKKSPKTRSPLR